MTLTTVTLAGTAVAETISPAKQKLLDKRADLMRHDVKYGLGQIGKSSLDIIEQELAALEDVEQDALRDIRLDLAARE